MKQPLDRSTIIIRNPDIISTDMDGETVMMSIDQGEYYGIKGIGTFLWEQMAEPATIDTLCQKVLNKYDIDEETCRADTEAFVADLLERGIVRKRT